MVMGSANILKPDRAVSCVTAIQDGEAYYATFGAWAPVRLPCMSCLVINSPFAYMEVFAKNTPMDPVFTASVYKVGQEHAVKFISRR